MKLKQTFCFRQLCQQQGVFTAFVIIWLILLFVKTPDCYIKTHFFFASLKNLISSELYTSLPSEPRGSQHTLVIHKTRHTLTAHTLACTRPEVHTCAYMDFQTHQFTHPSIHQQISMLEAYIRVSGRQRAISGLEKMLRVCMCKCVYGCSAHMHLYWALLLLLLCVGLL